ncbi:MAG: DNA modification methylase [Candidatus Andersenbacteria bacterium]|nr:DNA modification methylase [Candidatus Andersenbacteria bacterium]MBI3251192.1 DNA modification methylase [Candidatus Andersenbacteria bacterium]
MLTLTEKNGRTYAPINQLKNWDKNPRGITKDGYARLKKQIETLGEYKPLLVTPDGMVLGGNMRLKVYRDLNKSEAWVSVIHPKNEKEMLEYALSDNDRAGFYEEEKLAELALSVPELDLSSFSVDLGKPVGLERLVQSFGPEAEEDNFDEALPEEPESKIGEIYELGPHRLMCGDSTNEEHVRHLMNGKRAVLFATDPPYLVDYDGTNHPHKWNDPETVKKRKNKDWSPTYHDWDDAAQGAELYEGFIRVAIAEAITPDAAWYCWHASRNAAMLEKVWEQFGAFVHQQIVWVKDRPVLTRSWYMWQHEPCFFGWIKGKKPQRLARNYPSGVWSIPTIKPGTSTDHPTSKPVKLFAIPMQQHTKPGDICYEAFAGSGSQFIAAEQLGRICYAMEISPAYCDVIRKRYEAYVKDKK